MGLQMHCFDFFREVMMRKKSFGLGTLKLLIGYSFHQLMQAY